MRQKSFPLSRAEKQDLFSLTQDDGPCVAAMPNSGPIGRKLADGLGESGSMAGLCYEA
jgi:hypothetical protein